MKILLIGGGGREHALARSIADSPLTSDLRIAPGNPGMEGLGTLIQIKADDYDTLFDYAVEETVDLVVIGPEAPLVAGLADRLDAAGIRAFGPSAAAAQLEGSKAFARDFCTRHNIPQPRFFAAQDKDTAYRHIDALNGFCVVKADGLAAGKGVVVADTGDDAKAAADAMLGGRFGDASKTILIEERILGPEASLFALLDGNDALYMASAQDHKRAFDGDKGPNTGGMGAISPSPRLDDTLIEQVMDSIVRPLARGMTVEGTPYRGVLYVGLMLTTHGPQVIEFNCRFGDPEAQVILPRLKTDVVSAMLAATDGGLGHFDMRWDDANAVTIVMATKGYPGDYDKGSTINISENNDPDCIVFHAGTARDKHGQLIASGGRVLAVTGMGNDAHSARQKAYDAVAKIDWPDGFYRTDIAADS